MLKQYNHRLGAGEVVDIRLSLPPYYCPTIDETHHMLPIAMYNLSSAISLSSLLAAYIIETARRRRTRLVNIGGIIQGIGGHRPRGPHLGQMARVLYPRISPNYTRK